MSSRADGYRVLLDAFGGATWVWDPTAGRFTVSQPGWEGLTGEPEAPSREAWLGAFRPEDRPRLEGLTPAAGAEAPQRVRARVRGPRGGDRPVVVRAVPVLDAAGAVREWVGSVHPTEDPRGASSGGDRERESAREDDLAGGVEAPGDGEELADAFAFVDAIVENLPDMVFVKDAEELRFVRFNRGGEDLLGYSRRELIGKTDYDLFPAEQADFFTAMDQRVLEGGVPVDIPEEPLRTRARGTRWLHTKKVPLSDRAGRPRYLLGISEDITEKREGERAVARLQEVHHRVKNNLQVVQSLLSLQAGASEDPGVRHVLEESRGRIRAMSLIHEQLFGGPEQTWIDAHDYFRRLLGELRRSYLPREQEVDLDLRVPEGVRLSLDAGGPCGLIVHELVANSFRHAFPGGRSGTVQVRLDHAADERTELVVADDGVGLPRGFDPEAARSLGLRLVVQLVKQLRGELRVEAGAETRFTLRFPDPDRSS